MEKSLPIQNITQRLRLEMGNLREKQYYAPVLKSGKYTLCYAEQIQDGKWGDAHEVLIIRIKSFWAIVIWSILGAIAFFGFLLYLLNKKYLIS